MYYDKIINKLPLYYLALFNIIGLISIVLLINGYPLAGLISKLTIFGLLFPFIVGFLWHLVLPIRKNRKQAILQWIGHWGMIPAFFVFMNVSLTYGDNIIPYCSFYVIWILIGCLLIGLLYFYISKNHSYILEIIIDTTSEDERANSILRNGIMILLFTISTGILLTVYIPLKPIQQEKVKVTLHGKYAKGNTAYIWVDYQQKELKIRPTYKERQAVLDCDSVILTIQEGLFGMDYVRYVAPNSD